MSCRMAEDHSAQSPQPTHSRAISSRSLLLLLALFAAIYGATLATPALLDDADATHASAALNMARTGDLVTLKVDGIRYLEKPPLPYWLVALDFRLFCIHKHRGDMDTTSFNEDLAAFAVHLPAALAVLLLAGLGYRWALLAWGERAAFYSGLSLLTAAGVFLFTRVFIPEALLSLFLCAALFCFLRGLELRRPAYFYGAAVLIAFAVLTKGLIAPIFFGIPALAFLFLTGELRRWRELHLFRATLLFLAIAAPWHVLAGLRNRGGLNGRGFFWFYFINEHVLRFLGRRYPMDYNKLPGYLYWSLHLVWLFPWSLFFPLALIVAWRKWRAAPLRLNGLFRSAGFTGRSVLLLCLYSALVLCFFSLSTNQEYYTFPVYLPLAILLSAALAGFERRREAGSAIPGEVRWVTFAHAALTLILAAAATALCYGLWSSRHLPFVPDIGDLLAHRGVGNYTLSMSHFFDLTGPSFAALRLPAALAASAFAIGPAIAWRLRTIGRNRAATTAIALTSAVFLFAAHIALVRFEPMLSSRDLADKIQEVIDDHPGDENAEVYLYGDQAYGSSIPFYTGRMAFLVNGRTSSMIWGSTYADAPHIFLDGQNLLARWGTGPRKFLFVPMEQRDAVDALFATRPDLHPVLLDETSGKALLTDRALPPPGVGE